MLNWRDIQDRAIEFSHSYVDAKDEDRDAKPFWKDLFAIYGIDPRISGAFEERVRIHGRPGVGKIDYFSPKKFLIEHKSRGKDLDAAYRQAMDYFDALKIDEKPRHIIISDFEHIHLYDLEAPEKKRLTSFLVKDLSKHVKKLAFLANKEETTYVAEQAINVTAVRAIGKLHKALKESNYPSEHLSPLLTRLVFCFFADDTGIFEQNSMRRYVDEHTKEDGSDVGAHLTSIFQILSTPEDKRQSTANDILLSFPYVNGGLFNEQLSTVFGTRDIRKTLIECLEFDWSGVSPAVFGSMFQSVMDERERHDLGAHYTSEKNILKVIEPLFLNSLRDQLTKAKSEEKLRELWEKVASITLLDPACGCGNFLVIAYRELRRIEIEIIKLLDKGKKGSVIKIDAGQEHLGLDMDLKTLSKMSVERMYGIEIESFPAEVAKLSLWLMDHMMNMELGAYYGKPLKKLPLTEAPHIVSGVSALQVDWEEHVPKEKLTHILGNPPFLGKHMQSKEQKKELTTVFLALKNASDLDYVSGWYKKASDYIQGTAITCAFVSTNSITQGEQASILWNHLLSEGIKIQFAHRTFKWSNEARGKAAVYCVIVGFGLTASKNPKIFDYETPTSEPKQRNVNRINPYLVDALDVVVQKRSKPIAAVPLMRYGNKPSDSGALIFTEREKNLFLEEEPAAKKYFRKYIGAEEFINGKERWCLWLVGVGPHELRSMPAVLRRIDKVRVMREASSAEPTRKAAKTPWLFFYVSQSQTDYILIPETSSENRLYIPLGFVSKDVICSNATYHIDEPSLYIFGILQSSMHMAWMRAVGGRLKSDYRYSGSLVYNTFPWPNPTPALKEAVEAAAQIVLDERKKFFNATLADLYDPNTMPKELSDAHKVLDSSVDMCYGRSPSALESERLEFLFDEYKRLLN